jgi:hypothetical protein
VGEVKERTRFYWSGYDTRGDDKIREDLLENQKFNHQPDSESVVQIWNVATDRILSLIVKSELTEIVILATKQRRKRPKMKMTSKLFAFSNLLVLMSGLIVSLSIAAEEIDFSCAQEKVLSKTPVNNRYREFDIVIENQCPGDVFYSMCIERMDPRTHKRLEALTPSGYVQVDKKLRLNLQMKKVENKQAWENAYEEFYLNIGYGLTAGVKPQCVASRCEQDKKAIRKKLSANHKAWQQAQNMLEKKIATQCPDTGWEQTADENCITDIRREAGPEMAEFASNDSEFQDQLAAVNPQQCSIHMSE